MYKYVHTYTSMYNLNTHTYKILVHPRTSMRTYILACKHMYKNVHVCISMLTYVYECTKIVHPRTSMTYT